MFWGLGFNVEQGECCSTTGKIKPRLERFRAGGDGQFCMLCQVLRSGHPAATQACSSLARQKSERPMRIGCGILPLVSQDRQVRTEMPHWAAASAARRRSGVRPSSVTPSSLGTASMPAHHVHLRCHAAKKVPTIKVRRTGRKCTADSGRNFLGLAHAPENVPASHPTLIHTSLTVGYYRQVSYPSPFRRAQQSLSVPAYPPY